MPVKVVMQSELPMGAAERIREMAEVVIDPDLDPSTGADIVVVVGGKRRRRVHDQSRQVD